MTRLNFWKKLKTSCQVMLDTCTLSVGQSVSFGNITETEFWISLERKPLRWWRWGLHFGPTYNGTIWGVVLMTPCIVVISHIRKESHEKKRHSLSR